MGCDNFSLDYAVVGYEFFADLRTDAADVGHVGYYFSGLLF